MFTNVGGEIKSKAVRYVFWHTLRCAILLLLPVIALGIWGVNESIILILIIAWLLCVLIAYFRFRDKAMLLYAQGEITENVMIIKNILSEKSNIMYNFGAQVVTDPCVGSKAASVQVQSEPVQKQPEEGFWICGSCRTDNLNSYRFCRKCGYRRPF